MTVGISPNRFKQALNGGSRGPAKFNGHVNKLHDQAQQRLTGDISHIGSDAKSAISTWSEPSGYKFINNHLRGSDPNPDAAKLVHHLDSALNNHKLPEDVHVYRGLHGQQSQRILDPRKGTHFAHGSDLVHIHVPKGYNGLYVSHPKLNNWTAEREVLLPHNGIILVMLKAQYVKPLKCII